MVSIRGAGVLSDSSKQNRDPGAQKPKAGHPSPTRILLRALLWFWLSVMVSLITLLTIMLSGYAPGLLRSSVTIWVEDQTGASLEIGSLSGTLWSGFDLRDIRLSEMQEKSELNISRLRTKLRLRRSLLARRLVLQELVVEKLNLTLRRGVAGDWWISGLGPVSEPEKTSAPTETPGNPGFEIERFALEAARVEWGHCAGRNSTRCRSPVRPRRSLSAAISYPSQFASGFAGLHRGGPGALAHHFRTTRIRHSEFDPL